ncbi:MAG: hypothetical protein ACRDTD_17230 [Pseudonocardiaceae bacterium]
MAVQGWWGNLLQGAVSALIGGVVAALTAWGVVSATRRHDRRVAIEREARSAALNLFVLLGEIQTTLTRAANSGSVLPRTTQGKEWALTVLTAEVAMFSLDRETGACFSQAIGDLRRALEPIEAVANPDPGLLQGAVLALQTVADWLANWLMAGRHRAASGRLPDLGSESSGRSGEPPTPLTG